MGIQAMWDGSGVHGSSTPFPALDFADLISVRVNSFGTVAAKFGYLVNPSLQLYGKTGIGWVAEKSTYFCSPLDCAVPGSPSVSWTRSGFDAGVGLTWMFRRNWDLFVEYDHMWLGTKSITYSPWDGGTLTENVRQAFDKVLVGIDYRFDWGKDPVVAKY